MRRIFLNILLELKTKVCVTRLNYNFSNLRQFIAICTESLTRYYKLLQVVASITSIVSIISIISIAFTIVIINMSRTLVAYTTGYTD